MEDCGERKEGTTVIDDLLHRHRLRLDGAGSNTAEEEEEVSKRRKVAGNNGVVLGLGSRGGVDISSPAKRSSDADGGTPSAESPSSSSSCCSSNESSDLVKDGLKLVDLEAESNFESETADSTSINNNTTKTKFSRETTPSSDLCADSDENTELASPAETKYPPREEIEEFFAAAEKSDQKRFAEKYNYDIVKDLPLEGRYQWVSLKP